jgi:DNA polymerase eta
MVRLGLDENTPLAVQQWQGLIAINYPARKFGLGRHVTSTEAKKLCPDIVLQHVATWREGDEKWAYHADAYKNMGSHKASLDPYRRESRKILAVVKDALPAAPMQRVEKAGIDEVFLDLSAQVHSLLLNKFPELKNPPPYDDPTEYLPWPSTTALDWNTDALVDLDGEESEESDPDWDDVCLSIAGEIVRHVRMAIRDKLKYTCSGGIARNKMLAKLGSAHNKPNAQTVIRGRAIQHFLNGKKFTRIRNLGGKLGDEAVAMFNTDEVKTLLNVPLEQLQKLGDGTGAWLYETIRGQDTSEVSSRTQIKSMLSAKSFRPSINTFEQGLKWIRIFVADIFGRCVEEGVLENKRRPKTINLHHRSGGTTRSKQVVIPQGKMITEDLLFTLAKTLLAQIVVDGRAWPCANLSLSAAGFEDTISGNMGIKTFLLEGDEAKALIQQAENMTTEDYEEPPDKKRKVAKDGIMRFFSKANDKNAISSHQTGDVHAEELEALRDTFYCAKCSKDIANSEHTEHDDWHLAKELEAELHSGLRQPITLTASRDLSKGKSREKVRSRTPQTGNRRDVDKRQMQLNFGNG